MSKDAARLMLVCNNCGNKIRWDELRMKVVR